MDKYVYSFNEERFDSEEFDSREEALNAARHDDPDSVVWTGIVAKLKISDALNFGWIWDGIEENFWEIVGDVSEMPKPSPKAVEAFSHAIDAWAIAYDLHPKFFRVDNIIQHRVNGRD